MVPVFAALTSAAVLAIPADAINHDRARDLNTDGEASVSAAGYRILFKIRPLMIFSLCTFFFHFANAPLLPLVGQKLALEFPKEATAMMSFCIVAAQGAILPIAVVVGHRADDLCLNSGEIAVQHGGVFTLEGGGAFMGGYDLGAVGVIPGLSNGAKCWILPTRLARP